MAFSFIARMKVFPDKEAHFVSLCKQMEALVAAHEPGTLGYKFYKLREPYSYAVFESFVDEAAEEAHRAYEHGKPFIADMIHCLDGDYHREFLDPLE
jgi:(4S)-4-hydroxy-5-phosphonooxypentane-2,3-dione isomerase